MATFIEKYRPQRIADLRGQDHVVFTLSEFIGSPSPIAYLFSGDTGTGKTSAAHALARDLGCAVEQDEFGGLYEIASGEQTADSIRTMMRMLWTRPFYGSGWKVLIVNECDRMHAQAETIWLDVLENLPGHTVVVFTTNEPGKLSDRFKDRCQCLSFESSFAKLKDSAAAFVRDIWQAETGNTNVPKVLMSGVVREDKLSFRRLVNLIGSMVRDQQGKIGSSLFPAEEAAVLA